MMSHIKFHFFHGLNCISFLLQKAHLQNCSKSQVNLEKYLLLQRSKYCIMKSQRLKCFDNEIRFC